MEGIISHPFLWNYGTVCVCVQFRGGGGACPLLPHPRGHPCILSWLLYENGETMASPMRSSLALMLYRWGAESMVVLGSRATSAKSWKLSNGMNQRCHLFSLVWFIRDPSFNVLSFFPAPNILCSTLRCWMAWVEGGWCYCVQRHAAFWGLFSSSFRFFLCFFFPLTTRYPKQEAGNAELQFAKIWMPAFF